MTDTISNVFGLLDGTATIDENNLDFNLTVNGINTNGELQDVFLECLEEIGKLN